MSNIARKNWRKSLEDGNPQATLEWLKRKEKDEFSERMEQTGGDGEPIKVNVIKYADNNPTV